jgi:tetratricopeptide (TPR) repeat protein
MANAKRKSQGQEIITSLTGFIEWATALKDGKFLFRGHANKDWPLQSGAARRVFPKSEVDIDYSKVELYMQELLNRSRLRGFDNRHNHSMHDLAILADLQHHGAATILLDLTKNAMMALWFACREEEQSEVEGKVIALNVLNVLNILDVTKIKKVNVQNINEELSFFFKQFKKKEEAFIWEPSHINERIPAQSSVFFIAKEPYSIEQKTVIIDKDAKKAIRKQLEAIFGMNEETVFPDFSGFALANAVQKPRSLTDSEYYFNMGVTCGQAGKYNDSLMYLDKAVEASPEDSVIYSIRGWVKSHLESNKEAIEDFDKAIELNPEESFTYYQRGMAKYKLERYADAIEDFDKAIELNPEESFVYYQRGMAKCRLERYADAIEDYTKGFELDPEDSAAYRWRGLAKYDLKRYKEAIEDFDKSIELDPENSADYYWRGRAKYALERYAEAREDLLKSRDLAKSSNDLELFKTINDQLKIIDIAEQSEQKQ